MRQSAFPQKHTNRAVRPDNGRYSHAVIFRVCLTLALAIALVSALFVGAQLPALSDEQTKSKASPDLQIEENLSNDSQPGRTQAFYQIETKREVARNRGRGFGLHFAAGGARLTPNQPDAEQ